MIVLALDQALKTSGFAIFNDKKLEAWGTFDIRPTLPIEQRLQMIFQHLDTLEEKYHFTYVFFEDTQKQTNLETYKKLCYVQAAVLLWCYFKDKKYFILAPSHWRSILKDKYKINWGKARKDQKKAAQEWVKNNYDLGVEGISEDEADAVCIGAAGILENFTKESAW